MPAEPRPLDIAVVGGGIAGIAAAHYLSRSHRVTLFEAGPALGGHARSIRVDDGAGGEVAVDTAFMIFNEDTYPLFLQLVDELGGRSRVVRAEMSACFSDEARGLHYAMNRGLWALFNGYRNIWRPAFYRMFAEVLLFRRRASADLAAGWLDALTLGEYLASYSDLFRENFVLPLAACIWSLSPGNVWSYPAATILRFFDNHRLLSGRSRYGWRTFQGASAVYVEAFRKAFRGQLRLGVPVCQVRRDAAGVALHDGTGEVRFDRLVLATHADTALALLAEPTPDERDLLGVWTYQANTVALHTDARLMPPDRRLWASWNYRATAGGPVISYHLNRVQSLQTRRDLFLSLVEEAVAPEYLLDLQRLTHPVFDAKAVATQARLGSLNGSRHTYYCGSYFGFGFHEDAVRSAHEVVRLIG